MERQYPFDLFKFGEARTVKDGGEEAKAREQGFTDPYKFQEYPKHLYLNGDRQAADVVVENVEDERTKRSDGFRMIGDPAPEATAPEAKKAEKKVEK